MLFITAIFFRYQSRSSPNVDTQKISSNNLENTEVEENELHLFHQIDSIFKSISDGEIIAVQYTPHVIVRGDDGWSILDKNDENHDQVLSYILAELSNMSLDTKEENTSAYSIYSEKIEVHSSNRNLVNKIGKCADYIELKHPEYGINEMFCILFLLFVE